MHDRNELPPKLTHLGISLVVGAGFHVSSDDDMTIPVEGCRLLEQYLPNLVGVTMFVLWRDGSAMRQMFGEKEHEACAGWRVSAEPPRGW